MSRTGCGPKLKGETLTTGVTGDLVVDRIHLTATPEQVRDRVYVGATPRVDPTLVDSSRQTPPGEMIAGTATVMDPAPTMNPLAEEGMDLIPMTVIPQIMTTRQWWMKMDMNG